MTSQFAAFSASHGRTIIANAPLMLTLVALAIAFDFRRLPPRAFPSVPAAVRRTLEGEGCAIPQASPSDGANNIVRGHFRSHTRTDYAALCSRGGRSTVFIMNGVTGAILARLGRQRDEFSVEIVSDPKTGKELHQYTRELMTVAPMPSGFCLGGLEGLEEHPKPCPCRGTSLDGVADVFETHCWRNGWHTVTSGD